MRRWSAYWLVRLAIWICPSRKELAAFEAAIELQRDLYGDAFEIRIRLTEDDIRKGLLSG